MNANDVTPGYRASWQLTPQEVAHAMPVLQAVHPGLLAAPAPRLSTIRHLARRWGIRDGTLRTALSRACSNGSLEASAGRYRLGPASREEVASAKGLLARTRGYVLGVVLEGEQADLPRLRELFVRLGFRSLQRSVWVGARTADERLTAALRSAGLQGSVLVFACDEVDAAARVRLSAVWRLAGRAEDLRRVHAQVMDYLADPGIGAREAAWRCVEVAPAWYRVAIRDEPPFPLDLRGPDYPLDRLTGDWAAHLESMTPALVDLWRSEER
jgi:DNA-binding transcriptional regulator PaaX